MDKTLWYWVKERERIRINKEAGQHRQTWTRDPILAKYRFCNVRREDDKVTRWVHDNIRVPYADYPYLWFMLCIARQINWPPSLQELMNRHYLGWPVDENFSLRDFTTVLEARAKRGEKTYTGAYIITAGPRKGVSKPQYQASKTLGALWRDREKLSVLFNNRPANHRLSCPTLKRAHARLHSYNGWGQFLAYQAVVDMRFTKILNKAPDRHDWAAAGPGTIRGLNRTFGRPYDFRLKQDQALDEMRQLDDMNPTGVKFDFSDIPNILCETDKYLRVKTGQGRPRAFYQPSDAF